MKVLVVDDSPTFLAAAGDALEENGYEVMVARSGDEGIRFAKAWNPDLIIMDIEMPFRGDKAAGALRLEPETSEIPIIAMTSLSKESLGDNAMLFNDYLTKPFGLAELVKKARSFTG